jgi:hypothetical protein
MAVLAYETGQLPQALVYVPGPCSNRGPRVILQESILETPEREPLSPRFGASRCDDYESLIPHVIFIAKCHKKDGLGTRGGPRC